MKSPNKQLLDAILKGKAKKICRLVEKGADPNAMVEDDRDRAIVKGWSFLMVSAKLGNVALMDALVSRGADVNFRTASSGKTALMVAANDGYTDCLEFLIDRGAEVNAEDDFGYTALINVCRNYSSETPAIECLLAHGAEINHQDKNGFTPFMCAATANKDRNVLLCLIRHGADLTIRNKEGNTVMDVLKKRDEQDTYDFLVNVMEKQTLDLGIKATVEVSDEVAF